MSLTRVERTAQFRRALRNALQERRLTQTDLARKISRSGPTISNWLSGRFEPSALEVFEIERALRIPAGALSVHLGYVPVDGKSALGCIAAHLSRTEDGRSLLSVIPPPS